MRKSQIFLFIFYAGALLDLSAIKNKSSIALREFIDEAKNHLCAFEKLDEVPLWDTMILQDFILTKKLDSRLGE